MPSPSRTHFFIGHPTRGRSRFPWALSSNYVPAFCLVRLKERYVVCFDAFLWFLLIRPRQVEAHVDQTARYLESSAVPKMWDLGCILVQSLAKWCANNNIVCAAIPHSRVTVRVKRWFLT